MRLEVFVCRVVKNCDWSIGHDVFFWMLFVRLSVRICISVWLVKAGYLEKKETAASAKGSFSLCSCLCSTARRPKNSTVAER